MIVTVGSRCRVLWGVEALPGVVTHVFKGAERTSHINDSLRTRYEVTLDNGRCCTTTIDGILEP